MDVVTKVRRCWKTFERTEGSNLRPSPSNTSNLLVHLRTSHSKIHADVKAAMSSKTPVQRTVMNIKQPTLAETIGNSQSYEWKGTKWKELTDVITFFVARDTLPIYTIEKSGFKWLLNSLDPRYELPSRFYFSRTAIPTLYASIRDKVKQELSKVPHFSATIDLWSSIGMRTYISYTIHCFKLRYHNDTPTVNTITGKPLTATKNIPIQKIA